MHEREPVKKNLTAGGLHLRRDLGLPGLTRTAAWGLRNKGVSRPLSPATVITLQRAHLEVAPEIGFYALRRGDGT
jgi:hypothetical protein